VVVAPYAIFDAVGERPSSGAGPGGAWGERIVGGSNGAGLDSAWRIRRRFRERFGGGMSANTAVAIVAPERCGRLPISQTKLGPGRARRGEDVGAA